MPTFRVKESKFGAPAGIYSAEFLGIAPFGDGTPRNGRDGKPMPPAVEWQFKVTDGEFAGQIIGRITSAEPTVGNSCGQLIRGLLGHTPTPDEDVNTDLYVGQVFQAVVSPSKESPDKTYVTQVIRPKAGGAVKPATATATATPTPKAPAAPPPAKPAPAPKPAPAGAKKAGPDDAEVFWVDDGSGETGERSAAWIRQNLMSGALKEEDIKVMSHDQSSGWKTPTEMGVSPPF